MDTTRVFAAIEIVEPACSLIQRDLLKISTGLGGVRWTEPDQLHITLKFLGEIDNTLLPAVCRVVDETASAQSAFPVQIGGVSAFPEDGIPKVIWARVSEGAQELAKLHQELDRALVELGVPAESRKYTPHLTLGRTQKGFDVDTFYQQRSVMEGRFQTMFHASEVVLMSSERERGRFVYHPLSRTLLA